MRILILHHVETCWADTMFRHFGVDFDDYLQKVQNHLDDTCYDKVILNRFEGVELEPEHWFLASENYQVNEYAYGWEVDMFDADREGVDFCPGGDHSQVVQLDDWMRWLKDHEVHVAGAFDGECIEDLEIALNYLEVEFNRVEHLIV